MQPARVLIVDDDCFQRSLVRLLVVHTYPAAIVTETHNGQAALAAYETEGADLIITDVQMPVMDGITLTRTIRSRNSTVPIIAISGAVDTEAAARCAGASRYLAKGALLAYLPQMLTEILPAPFVPGQQVIWIYRPQRRRSRPYAVAAEVAQISALRVRIRVRTASGKTLLRWVDPKNVHAKAPDEPDYPYPEPA